MNLKTSQIYKFVINFKSSKEQNIAYYRFLGIRTDKLYQFELISHNNVYKYWNQSMNIFFENLCFYNISELTDEDKVELL